MFEKVDVILLLPLFVGLVDACLHLLESALEHLRELVAHVIDLLLQPCDVLLLALFHSLLLLLQFFVVLCEAGDHVRVSVDLPLELLFLLRELLEARLVLASHVRHDVPLTVVLLLEQAVQLHFSVALLVLRGLRAVRHLLLHDEPLGKRLDLGLQDEVLLDGVRIRVGALLLALLSSLAFLLASHLF